MCLQTLQNKHETGTIRAPKVIKRELVDSLAYSPVLEELDEQR